MFGRKVARRHKRVTLLAVALGGLAVIGAGCLPDPQTLQSRDLLDRLVAARGLLGQQPPQTEAGCDTVGDVQTRLFGEPGLVDVRPAWSARAGSEGCSTRSRWPARTCARPRPRWSGPPRADDLMTR